MEMEIGLEETRVGVFCLYGTMGSVGHIHTWQEVIGKKGGLNGAQFNVGED